MAVKIAVLPSFHMQNQVFAPKHIHQLEAIGEVVRNEGSDSSVQSVQQLLEEADFAVTSWGCPAMDKQLLDRAPQLKAVIHAAGTVKGIVTPELWRRNIRVSSANGPLGKGVAETALGLTIAGLKNMWRLTRDAKSGGWQEERSRVRELYDITVGVIGAGKAGSHYIRLLQNFDVNVLLYDPIVSDERASALGAQKAELEELLRFSDVVSIHAPSLPSTYRMFNGERLALMKDDAILINTARGSIVDEEALIVELRKGRLFACLDVTDPEPPAPDHPFRSLPNCVLTCHVAGSVTNGLHRLGKFAVEELNRFLAGERMEGEVEERDLAVLA